jgi:uncharacterized membrane protein
MPEQSRAGHSELKDSPVQPHDTDKLMSSLEHESDDLWKQHRAVALLTLTLPVWASLSALVIAVLWGGFSLARKLVVATMASAAAGRFIIWTGTDTDHALGFSSLELALLVLCLDIIWAIVLTWHAGILFHVPSIGPGLRTAVQEGSQLLKRNGWMRRITVVAVVAFVTLPISSTGSIGGSLLGRLLGLSRSATLASVLVGSVLGGAIMLLFAKALAPWFQNITPAARYGGIAIIVLMGIILSRRYRRAIAD